MNDASQAPKMVLGGMMILDDSEMGSSSSLWKTKSTRNRWAGKPERSADSIKTSQDEKFSKTQNEICVEQDTILYYEDATIGDNESKVFAKCLFRVLFVLTK